MSNYDASKPSRAVVAIHKDYGLVLWSVGQINDEVQVDGHDADALGLLDEKAPEAGIWVWEGRYIEIQDSFGTYAIPKGEFRRPTESEWDAIRNKESPWQDGLWLKSTLLRMC